MIYTLQSSVKIGTKDKKLMEVVGAVEEAGQEVLEVLYYSTHSVTKWIQMFLFG